MYMKIHLYQESPVAVQFSIKFQAKKKKKDAFYQAQNIKGSWDQEAVY